MLVLDVTDPPGPGLDPDSAFYIGGAKSIAAGRGFRAPIALWLSPDSTAPVTHFPPGLSTAIAVPARLGMSAIQGARLVNAVAAFAATSTAVYLAAVAAGPLAAALLGLALFVTPALVSDHLDVLSEPLFLACAMLALLGMVRTPERPLRAGIAAAIATIVRYAGMAVSGAVMLWAFLQGGTLRQRLRRAAVGGVPTLLIQGAWILHARKAAGSGGIRTAAVYTAGFGHTLAEGWTTISSWLVPLSEPAPNIHQAWIGALTLLLLVVVVAVGARHAGAAARVLAPAAVLLACYVGMIVTSRLLGDPFIPFDDRILSPFILLAELIGAVAAARWWTTSTEAGRIAILAAFAIWWAASLGVTSDAVNWALTNGDDMAGDEWRRSPLLDWARTHAPEAVLYSNWPSAVNFQLDRAAHDLPFTTNPAPPRAFADTIRSRHAVILDFDAENPEFISNGALVANPVLVTVAKLADGRVMKAR